MKETKLISLTSFADLAEEMQSYMPVSISIGPRGEPCLLLTKEQPPLHQGMFPQTVTEEAYDYKIVILREAGKQVLHLPNEHWNYHFVQPLDQDQILLAGARSEYHSADHIEENASVFTKEGECLRSFCLGDGIEDLYAARDNSIWTSYFDEGVYGNFGWETPIGRHGLIRWDDQGRQLEQHDSSGDHHISDCYAMNVVSDGEVWFYYYMDFELGVRKAGQTVYYKPDVKGASRFAVHGDKLIMNGGYGDQEQFFELERDGSRYVTKRLIQFRKPDGSLLRPQATSNRGRQLLFLDGTELYRYEVGN